MGSRRALTVLVGLSVVVAVAGCTKSEAGQAAPVTTTETSTSQPPTSSGGATPTVAIPPRPKELRLDSLEPCTLFTQTQLTELNVTRTRTRTDNSAPFEGMKECILEIRKEQFYEIRATAVTNEGIGSWLTGKRNVEAKLTSVAGFAAATYWIRGASGTRTDGCTTAVDVADGQELLVDTNNDSEHSFALEQLCQRAEGAAALAMQTLQTLK